MAITTKVRKERISQRYAKVKRMVIVIKAVQSACEKQLALIGELETLGVSEVIEKAGTGSLLKTKRLVADVRKRMESPKDITENEMYQMVVVK